MLSFKQQFGIKDINITVLPPKWLTRACYPLSYMYQLVALITLLDFLCNLQLVRVINLVLILRKPL